MLFWGEVYTYLYLRPELTNHAGVALQFSLMLEKSKDVENGMRRLVECRSSTTKKQKQKKNQFVWRTNKAPNYAVLGRFCRTDKFVWLPSEKGEESESWGGGSGTLLVSVSIRHADVASCQ